MNVPLLDLKAQYSLIKPEIDEAIARVVASQRFIMGPDVAALEGEIADYCNTRHAVGCASGSEALLLALMALGVGPGDEVLCPAYSFFATAGSVVRLGAIPVFADIDPATYNLDPASAREKTERCSRLRAVIPVHLFGQTADMDALVELGRDLNVPIIEDAAQAIGARDLQGARAGSRGAVGCFSFFPSKNLGAYGDGGMVTTNDTQLADRLRILREHGASPKYIHKAVGLNSRLDALQAAVLRVKLRHLETWSDARAANAAFYGRAWAESGARPYGEPSSSGSIGLQFPQPTAPKARHVYNQFVIRVPAAQRDPLRAALTELGIGTQVYYPLGLHQQECFAGLDAAREALPETESAARESLAIPIYPELSSDQLAFVAASVTSSLEAPRH